LRKRKGSAVGITILIGLIVAASAYFALAQSGFSYDYPLTCGFEEHEHDETCYAVPELICDLEEIAEHTHIAGCYDDWGNLVCGLVEAVGHKHGDECYFTEMDLICDLEEISEEEIKLLDFAEGEEPEPHTHGPECYFPALLCGLDEHAHDVECYLIDIVGAPDTGTGGNNGSGNGNDPGNNGEKQGTEEPGEDGDDPEGTDETGIVGDPESGDLSDDINKKPERPRNEDDRDIIDPEAPGDDETDEPGDEDPIDDPDDPDELEEEEEEEPEEEELDDEGVSFVTAGIGVDENKHHPKENPSVFGSIIIPVVKTIAGEGGLGALDEDDDYHFLIRLQEYDFENEEPGDIIEDVELRSPNFNGGLNAVIEFEIDIETLRQCDYPAEYYYMISELPDTAGEDWVYDANVYIIKVVVEKNGNVTYYDGGGKPIGGIVIASVYMRMSEVKNNPYIEPEEPFHLVSRGEYYSLPGVSHRWYLFEISSGNINPIFAVCADYGINPSSGDTSIVYHEKRNGVENNESILAFAMFDEQYGAKLSMDEFNDIFGFGPEHPKGLRRIDTDYERRGLLQFVIWWYELKYLGINTYHPLLNRYWSTKEQWDVTNPSVWPENHPNPLSGGEEGRTIYLSVTLENQLGTDVYFKHFLAMLLTIERMTDYHNMLTTKESITSYSMRYTPGVGSVIPATIDIVQSGYQPPAPYDLTLSWTGGNGVVVESYNGAVSRDTNLDASGNIIRDFIKVRPGDTIRVYGVTGEVTFTLTDDVYYLAGNSIEGMLFATYNESMVVDEGKDVFQRMLMGYADFVKLRASITVNESNLQFVNLYTLGFELPETIGFGVDTYIITGAALILISVMALFAQSVRPARQGVYDQTRARLLSLVGKRTRKRWYGGRRRE